MQAKIYGFLMFLIASYTPMAAFAIECDHFLLPTNPQFGYAKRGDRCEGLYVSPVSAPPIDVVSVTRGPLSALVQQGVTLQIALATLPLSPGPVHLRAIGLPSALYYRMDADLGLDHPITWPIADVVKPAKLRGDQLGIFAFVDGRGAGTTLMPVTISLPGLQPAASAEVSLILRATVPVLQPKWRFLVDDKTIGNGKLAGSGDRFTLELPSKTVPVEGMLEVTWNDVNGMPRIRSFMLRF